MKRRTSWSSEDRQRFSDGDRLRASTVEPKRFDGPESNEWDQHFWEWIDADDDPHDAVIKDEDIYDV